MIILFISENEKARALKLKYRAYHDPLTGALNRYALEDYVKELKRGATEFVFVHIEITRFDYLIHTLGLKTVDYFLTMLHDRLKAYFPKKSLIARVGNNEFSIILFDKEKLTHLLDELNKPYLMPDKGEIFITYLVGVARYPQDGKTFNRLMQYASLAIATLKVNEKQGIQFFERSMAIVQAEHMKIYRHLENGIKNDEFYLNFQPQFSISNGEPELMGMEILIRWENERLGLVSPSVFIPLAEKEGLITEIGDWVLGKSLQQIKVWEEKGLLPQGVKVSVNFTIPQLYRANAFEIILKELEKLQVAPERLCVEITETILMLDKTHIIALLEKLQNIGVKVALDDFGTGYSSLSYLMKIPINYLKIDKSFVDAFKTQNILLRSIIKIAKAFSYIVIAEGVETEEQLNLLKHLGCDQVQGYLLSKPLSTVEMEKLLVKSFKTH